MRILAGVATKAVGLLLIGTGVVGSSLAAEPTPPLAVVSLLDGRASVREIAGGAQRPLRLFDWLSDGAAVAVEPTASVTLAFADGRRWRIKGKARVRLQADGPQAEEGKVEALDRVPTLPRIAAVASEDGAGGRPGAVRIRQGERMTCLYPGPDARALPDRTTLSFDPVQRASGYRATIEDEGGRVVFSVETRQATIDVPPGVLEAGRRYYWSVRTLQEVGPSATGDSGFATLDGEDIKQRDALRLDLEKRGDAESQGLLAEVDRRLGLLLEARKGFEAARMLSPDSEALAAARGEIDAFLRRSCEVP